MEPDNSQSIVAKKSIVPAIVSAVIVSALVAGGGAYAYERSQQTKQSQDLQSQIDSLKAQLATAQKATPAPTIAPVATTTPTATANPTPTPTADATAGWKTYSDTSSGASFKYPTTWSAVGDGTGFSFKSPESVAASQKNTIDYQADVLGVMYYASLKDFIAKSGGSNTSVSLSDWLKSQKGTPGVQDYAQTMMPLVNYGSYPVFSVGNSYPSTSFYMELNSKIFIFRNNAGGDLSEIGKNILESIKVAQ